VKEALATFLDQIKSMKRRGIHRVLHDVTERVKINDLKNNRSALVRAVTNLDSGGNTALLEGWRPPTSACAAQRSQPHQCNCGDDRRQTLRPLG
jgi:hypothetical protein